MMSEGLLYGIIVLESFFLIILFILSKIYYSKWKNESSKKMSVATTHGRIYEQYFPFLKDYPYDPRGFRFLGTPIDGVQFEKDGIVFIEFKSGSSRLSERQRRIKNLVMQNKVTFREFYLK